jgi:hypothetical protein
VGKSEGAQGVVCGVPGSLKIIWCLSAGEDQGAALEVTYLLGQMSSFVAVVVYSRTFWIGDPVSHWCWYLNLSYVSR